MRKRGLVSQVFEFIRHVVPAILRPLRALWNEVIGVLFLVLAVWAVPSAIRSIRQFDGDPGGFFRIVITGLFIVLMTGFGISSFLRARKISRS